MIEGNVVIRQNERKKRKLSSGRPVGTSRAKEFYCPKCKRGFTLRSNLNRHYNYECGFLPRYKCPYCDLKSKQTSPIYSHIRRKHPGSTVRVETLS